MTILSVSDKLSSLCYFMKVTGIDCNVESHPCVSAPSLCLSLCRWHTSVPTSWSTRERSRTPVRCVALASVTCRLWRVTPAFTQERNHIRYAHQLTLMFVTVGSITCRGSIVKSSLFFSFVQCDHCKLHFRHKSQLRLHLRQKHGTVSSGGTPHLRTGSTPHNPAIHSHWAESGSTSQRTKQHFYSGLHVFQFLILKFVSDCEDMLMHFWLGLSAQE